MSKFSLISTFAAIAVSAAATASASANVTVNTEVFDLGSVTLGAGQSVQFDLLLVDNPKGVIGFKFEFDYFESFSDASFASDLQLQLLSPLGDTFIVGGFDNVAAANALWSFTGPDPGSFMDEFFPWELDPLPKGLWNLSLTNDWAADPFPNEYNNMTITFYKIPEPATLVLLALGGLFARRRRR